MRFRVLYVEDHDGEWSEVEAAFKAHNDTGNNPPLDVTRAKSPTDLASQLSLEHELILADVYFEKVQNDPDPDDRLDEIIEVVRSWERRHNQGRPTPIIAYTGVGEDALKNCLRRRTDLYDIWDKNSAFPEYVAWRLSVIAGEIRRERPDTLLQSLIRRMKTGARWHKFVVEMAEAYDAARTEAGQIEAAAIGIKRIASHLGTWDRCEPMWRAMRDWEFVARAVAPGSRGHARHVINVFWLGYYLIHHPALSDWFESLWPQIRTSRGKGSPALEKMEGVEALSDSWFYAGLFHDVGGCIESAHKVSSHLEKVYAPFRELGITVAKTTCNDTNGWRRKFNSFLEELDEPLRQDLTRVADDTLGSGKLDQGLVAAVHLREISSATQRFFAREAARAAAVHNVVNRIGPDNAQFPFTWTDEPIACLLITCDQLQTWDRGVGDQVKLRENMPQRAELVACEATKSKRGARSVRIDINYVPPPHVARSPDLQKQVGEDLEHILNEYPVRALKRLNGWPFDLRANCFFGDTPLPVPIDFSATE